MAVVIWNLDLAGGGTGRTTKTSCLLVGEVRGRILTGADMLLAKKPEGILTSVLTPSGFFSTERWLDGRSPTSAVQPPIPLPASCSPSPLRFPGGSSGSDGPSSFLPPKPG